MRPWRPDQEARRRTVASLLLQGFALDQITTALGTPDKKTGKVRFINRRTGKPYERTAIYRDMVALQDQWLREGAQDTKILRARQIAGINHLIAENYAKGDLPEVRMCYKREAELCGLDAPAKLDVIGLARTLAEAAARMAGLSHEEIAAVGDRAVELAK